MLYQGIEVLQELGRLRFIVSSPGAGGISRPVYKLENDHYPLST